MRKNLITFVFLLFAPLQVMAMSEDDPLLSKVMIHQLENRKTDAHDLQVWKAQAWIGKDLHKLWLKTEGEREDNETEDAELQLLYSRAVNANWNFQIGWRGDFKPKPERDWLALGFHGIAPYFIETDIALFVGEDGRTSFRLDAEYELMLTQKLVLVPEVEINVYGKADEVRGVGKGLSNIEAGLRLGYEFRREFAPYIGVNWEKQYGDTADLTRAEGGDPSDRQWVAGVRVWF